MEFLKENFFTIILGIMVIIMISVVYFFITEDNIDADTHNIMSSENIENRNEIKEVVANEANEKNINENTVIEILEDANENIVEQIDDESEINNSILDEIANKFNNSNYTKNMMKLGYIQSAIARENEIEIKTNGDNINFNFKFILDNNILYTEIDYNEEEAMRASVEILLSVILLDCVGQTKGYSEGVLQSALNEDVAMNYTIENEGVEIKQISDEKVNIKIDLNSNFPFLDK